MPADTIQVDYDGLAQAARIMDDERQHVLVALRDVRAQVDVLKTGRWEGPAAEVFFIAMLTDVLPALQRLHDALGIGGVAFVEVSTVMAAAEEQASKIMWGGENTITAPGDTSPLAALGNGLASAMRAQIDAKGQGGTKESPGAFTKDFGGGKAPDSAPKTDDPDASGSLHKVSLVSSIAPPTPPPGPPTPPPTTPGVTPTPTAPPVSTATPTPTAPPPTDLPPIQPTNPAGDIFMGGMAIAGVMALSDGPIPVMDVPAVGVALTTLVIAGIAGLAYLLAMPHPAPSVSMSESNSGEAATGGDAVPVPTAAPSGYTDGSGYRVGEDGTVVVDPRNLPANPDDLLEHGWRETTDPRSPNRRTFEDADGNVVEYDPGRPGANGWEGRDHYHVPNPNSTSRHDQYLDVNGNPVRRHSGPSHIPATLSQR